MMQPINPPAYSERSMAQLETNSQNPLTAGYDQGQSQGQPLPYYSNGCSQVFYACQPVSTTFNDFNSPKALRMSIQLIVCGVLCIIFNSVQIGLEIGSHGHYHEGIGSVAHGIWGGVFFIIAGGIGIGASKNKSKCLIIAFMVMSILAAMYGAVILALAILGSVITYDGGAKAMNICLTTFGSMGGLVAIFTSILCCRAVGCCAPTTSPYVVPTQPIQFVAYNGNNAPGPVVILAASGSNPSYPTGYPAMQFAASAAPLYQPPNNIQTNPNQQEQAGPLMVKVPLDD